MKNPTLAYATALCMAVVVGSASVVLFMFSLFAEVMATSLPTCLLYVALPTVLLLGFSIVFARWHGGAARAFTWLSVPIFYVPIVCVFMAVSEHEVEALAFVAAGIASLLMLLQVVSRTCRR